MKRINTCPVLIIILIIKIYIIESHLLENRSRISCKNEDTVSLFLKSYFKYQKSVKIFNLEHEQSEVSTIITRNLMNHNNVKIIDEKSYKEENSLFVTNNGYLAFSTNINRYLFSLINHWSMNGPWLVVMELETGDINSEYLKVAWDEYQILHLVILVFDRNGFPFIYFYNPFIDVLYKEFLDENSVKNVIQIIERRVRNLYGYKLNVFLNTDSETYTKPVFDKYGNLVKYLGIDGEILEGIRSALNASISFVPERLDIDFLELEQILNRMISERKIDFLADARSLNKTMLTNVYAVQPVQQTVVVCGVRANQNSHVVDVFIGFLDTYGTLVFYLTILLLIFCLFYIARKSKGPLINDTFSRFFIDIIGIILENSRNLQPYTRTNVRLIITCTLILNLVVSSIYQASIVRELNVNTNVNQINTFEDLVQANVTILAYDEYTQTFKAGQNLSETHRKLYQNFRVNEKIIDSTMYQKIANDTNLKRICMIIKKYEALFLQSHFIDPTTGIHIIHIVKQPILKLYMTSHIPKWSPFVHIFNEMVVRLMDVGLLQKGFNDANIMIHLRKIRTWKELNVKVMKGPKQITLENLMNVFFVYLTFLIIAFIVLIIEIFQYYFCEKLRKNKSKR